MSGTLHHTNFFIEAFFFRNFNLFLLMFDFPKQYKENTSKHFDVLRHLISQKTRLDAYHMRGSIIFPENTLTKPHFPRDK